MREFFGRRWFLIVLACVLAAGMAAPEAAKPVADSVPRSWVVAGVLFLMALPLDIHAMWRVARAPCAPALAIGMNYLFLPPAAWLASFLLPGQLATGLIVAATVPCTLASAVVWTRRSGGNESVALFVTVFTNLACFLVTPAWLRLLTAKSVTIPFGDMVVHLALLVVLPIVLGQAVRAFAAVRRWAARWKLALGVVAQLGILSIVFVGAVDSGLRLGQTNVTVSALHWITMIAAVLALHLAALFAGFRIARGVGIARPDAQAVGIAGSQKTLMVGLEIAVEYYGGLAILPLVVYHVAQLLVDTVIADRWRETPSKR
jgi:solute carrier family 10 (sodium/bile acid cotransporter), member 7